MPKIDRTDRIRTYLQKVKTANKELTKKELFKDLLNRLYLGDKDIEQIIDAISLGSETTILNIPRKDRVHKGSADTLYNKIIIEFENDLKGSLDNAKLQLSGYLLGEFRSGKGYNFTLIASDFINWKIFSPDVSQLGKLEELKEDELILKEVSSASFTLTDTNVDDFYYWIDRFLFKEERQKATLRLIEEAFGYQSNVFIECFRELSSYFNRIKSAGEIQVSYDQWKSFLSIAYGTFDASDSNFLIHTYLSVFSKILAYAVVSNDDYINDNEMLSIIDGTIFHKYNIRNFVENDFFSWVKEENNFRSLKIVFRLIAQEISSFDFQKVEEDILKGVYQELIDLDTRHALGEYYTPDWLCERIFKEFHFELTDNILDPACGSGSFLRAGIHRIRELHPNVTAGQLADHIFGIDIHPLSVQIAKTTILLALGKEIINERRPIHINIIQANTLLAPSGVKDIFGNKFNMNIDKERYALNTQILEDVQLFDEALEVCEDVAGQTLNKNNETIDAFGNILRKQTRNKGLNEQIIESFYKIYTALKLAKENGRDSIWKFILQNLYKPYFLADRFDFIVGNPPWFTYSSISNEEYQDTLNTLARKYSVKPEKKKNFPHLEIAVIFLSYCSSYFLKENGKLAFVVPRSIFSADHHDNTRSGKSKGFRLTQIWDLNSVSPLFRIPCAVLFAEKAKQRKRSGEEPTIWKALPASGLEGKSFSGTLPTHNCSLKVASPKLIETTDKWYYVRQGKSTAFSTHKAKPQSKVNPYKKLFKQGATIVPRAFYFIDLIQETPPDWEDRLINIKTSPTIISDAKKPWKDISFNGLIESQFLFRTALSKSILPFALFKPDLIVLPVSVKNDGENGKQISIYSAVELMRDGFLEASKWFQNASDIWDERKTQKSKNMTANNRIDFQGGLTDQNLNAPFLVLYNSSAKDANATVIKRESLDLNFIVESKGYVYYTEQINEAYYLTAILNSNVPNLLMKDFQSRGLFGARDVHKKILDIYFPKFSDRDDRLLRLSVLGREAHEKVDEFLNTHPPIKELRPIHLGLLRRKIKNHLKEELVEMDRLVKNIISEQG